MLLHEFASELQSRGYKNKGDYFSDQFNCLITLAKQKPEVYYDPENFLLIDLEADRRSVFYNWFHQDREKSLQFLRLAEEEYQSGKIDSTIHYLLLHSLASDTTQYQASSSSHDTREASFSIRESKTQEHEVEVSG